MSVVLKEKLDTDSLSSTANSTTTRDIIIVTGGNAVGKTSASCYLQKSVSSSKTYSTSNHIADSQSLLEAMKQDDQMGGFHHTHEWCEKGSAGHSHEHSEPLFPFTVIDNKLPNVMRALFFNKLVTTLPETDELWFVEWAAGVNTNPGPWSDIDYSYATARKTIEKAQRVSGLLGRILAVVHIQAQMQVRCSLNRKRSLPSSSTVKEIEHGTAFWQKDQTVLQFYGNDDFYNVEDLFKSQEIPVFHIENDGTSGFFTKQLKTVEEALQKKLALIAAI